MCAMQISIWIADAVREDIQGKMALEDFTYDHGAK